MKQRSRARSAAFEFAEEKAREARQSSTPFVCSSKDTCQLSPTYQERQRRVAGYLCSLLDSSWSSSEDGTARYS